MVNIYKFLAKFLRAIVLSNFKNDRYLFALHFICAGCLLQTQAQPGARFSGTGYAAQALVDPWAVYHNPAGIAVLEKTHVSVYYENRYAFAAFNTLALTLTQHVGFLKESNAGLSFFRFGDDIFNQTRVQATFAHKIRGVSLGAQAEYYQTFISEIGNKSNLLLNFGGQATITKHLSFGASVYNINQAQITSYGDRSLEQKLPTILRLGTNYNPYNRLFILAEVEKDVEKPLRYKAGIEYGIIESIFVRTGFNVQPQVTYLGLGYRSFGFALDYAAQWHLQLGWVHALGLSYAFNSMKKIENIVEKSE